MRSSDGHFKCPLDVALVGYVCVARAGTNLGILNHRGWYPALCGATVKGTRLATPRYVRSTPLVRRRRRCRPQPQ
jgi:hypothetical protein